MRLENEWVLKMGNPTAGNPANPLEWQVPQLLHSWTQFRQTMFATEKDRKCSFSKVSQLPHIGSYSNYQHNCFKSHLIINEKGDFGSGSYYLLMQCSTVYHTILHVNFFLFLFFLLDTHFRKLTWKLYGMNIDFRHYRTEKNIKIEEFFYRKRYITLLHI